MQKVIQEKWDKLMEDFCKCIENMFKRCKQTILAGGVSIIYQYMYIIEYSKLYYTLIYLIN